VNVNWMTGFVLKPTTSNLPKEMRMRASSILVLVVMVVGCGKTETPPPGTTAPPNQPAAVVSSWKPRTEDSFRFKANFPLGDPTVRPVFFGNMPKGVEEGWDYSVNVYPGGRGEKTYDFGIRAARLRADATPADRTETLDIFTKLLPPPEGWTKSEPKEVTWAGKKATETTWSETGKPTKLTVRRLVTDSGVYVGYVKDLGELPPAEMAKFFDGFQLLTK
jgi:hypothetical protein